MSQLARRSLHGLGVTLALLALRAVPASAGDGVIEINHARALAGRVLPNDAPGYPVEIDVRGSYRLTSDLVVPASASGIRIESDDVALDLNGFAVRGPHVCSDATCSLGTTDGIAGTGPSLAAPRRSSVRNGTVSGFGGDGIRLGELSLVENAAVTSVGADGIELFSGVALANRVSYAGESALFVHAPSGLFRGNVFLATDRRGQGLPAVDGQNGQPPTATGPNVCWDGSCSRRGTRRFYLTTNAVDGANAPLACALGYHFASLYEISSPNALVYDGRRGLVQADSGKGPPTSAPGWARTGSAANASDTDFVGEVNCNAWTSSSPGDFGSRIELTSVWNVAAGDLAPWGGALAVECSSLQRAWCVED